MHRIFWSIQRTIWEVKGRLFVSYESYMVLLKYMTCIDITAVSGMGQPLVGCRNKRVVPAVREICWP